MRIKTQFIMTMLLFGVILVVIAVSAILTGQRVEKAAEQERIASSIAQGASELSYLANDYLIYREDQQLKRWQSRFTSFSSQVAGLDVDRSEQQALVANIQANQKRLREVFDSTVSAVENRSANQIVALDPAFLQVSWSRMAVQNQGLVSDASRLSQLLHHEMDRLIETRTLLIYVTVGLFGALLLASYMLTYRRILKSIATLQAGTAVIGSGNLDFRIDDKKKDEIGDLSHAFNRMTADLKTVTASKADLEREVAERNKAEERLRQQREWLQVTLTSIGDAVIATDTESKISFVNPVAAALTGWPIEEALGRPVQDLFRIINEKTREPGEDIVGRVLREGGIVALANHTALVARDGREIPIEDSAASIKDGSGRVAGVVLVFHDVTEKRRAAEALRESEHRVRAKLDAILSPEGDIGTLDLADMIDAAGIQALMDDFYKLAPVPMSILDRHGKVLVGVGWQPICTRFHRAHPETCAHCLESDTQLSAGLVPGEVRLYKCRNHMWDIATPIFIGGEHVGNVFSGQFLFEGEALDYEQFRGQARRYGFNEQQYVAALEAVPRLSRETVDTGMAFFKKLTEMLSQLSYSNIRLARLLSERDRLADSLQEHARRLQETNRELEGFAYTISHDLRAPLRAINGFARMLADDYGPSLEEEGKRRLAVIETNAIKMGLLIDDLLAFSRAGRTAMNVARIDMNRLVVDVVEALKTSFAGAEADVHVAALPAAHGDPALIRQVLANLLENAVKFSRNNPDRRIEVASFERDGEQVYFVKDNGVGFDMKYYDKLFGVFQRLVTDREFEGTGVGLAIVHRLVSRHGGRVWAEAKPGEGATFFFSLS